MQHLYKSVALSSLVALVLTLVGCTVSVSGSWLLAIPLSVAVGTVMIGGGAYTMMGIRSAFGLMQTGRIAQWSVFALYAALTLKLATVLLPSIFTAGLPLILSGIACAAAFVITAPITGVMSFRGRTWLPRRMPRS